MHENDDRLKSFLDRVLACEGAVFAQKHLWLPELYPPYQMSFHGKALSDFVNTVKHIQRARQFTV